MQDRYTGDVGDFGKYGLLRWLCGWPSAEAGQHLRLGVLWYRTDPDELKEKALKDGKHIAYLNPENAKRFEACDPGLYQVLKRLVSKDQRNLSAIEKGGILPPDTVYHSDLLSFAGMQGQSAAMKMARESFRDEWLDKALDKTASCDLIFLDPDNGLERPSASAISRKGIKFAFFKEVRAFHERGQSLMIYQHADRSGNAEEQVKYWSRLLEKHLPELETIWALRFHRGTLRFFLILPAQQHLRLLLDRLRAFEQTAWVSGKHFSFDQATLDYLTSRCAICGSSIPKFLSRYPNAVCKACDTRALNEDGNKARHCSQYPEAIEAMRKANEDSDTPVLQIFDGGDNPVFIDGIKCKRRYRFGGWVTMRDVEG